MTEFVTKVQGVLTSLGRKNGTAPQSSQDPLDEKLHYLFVDDMARSFFNARHKKSLEDVLKDVDDAKVKKVVQFSEKNSVKNAAELASTANYRLDLETKAPASRLDATVLKNELFKLGVSQDLINKAFEKATGTSAPAKTFKVTLL